METPQPPWVTCSSGEPTHTVKGSDIHVEFPAFQFVFIISFPVLGTSEKSLLLLSLHIKSHLHSVIKSIFDDVTHAWGVWAPNFKPLNITFGCVP